VKSEQFMAIMLQVNPTVSDAPWCWISS